jgi:hypothetical protein
MDRVKTEEAEALLTLSSFSCSSFLISFSFFRVFRVFRGESLFSEILT